MLNDCVDSVPENKDKMFPCRSPYKPQLCSSTKRLQTFQNKSIVERITPREMADAGFYYLGDGDRVGCFYCGGKLMNWLSNDNPWYEHAKWFPLCEYVLRKQGLEYVKNICQKHPNLYRPPLPNPSRVDAVKSLSDLVKVPAGQLLVKTTDPRVKKIK